MLGDRIFPFGKSNWEETEKHNLKRKKKIILNDQIKFLSWATKAPMYFSAHKPLKISIYWREKPIEKNFRAGQPKTDVVKNFQNGTLWSVRGSNFGRGGIGGSRHLNAWIQFCSSSQRCKIEKITGQKIISSKTFT